VFSKSATDAECCFLTLFVAVSLNGSVIGVPFTEAKDSDGLDAEPLAGDPSVIAAMALPNIMIVDATGNAAQALLSISGEVSIH
jgi:hypothetical protein